MAQEDTWRRATWFLFQDVSMNKPLRMATSGVHEKSPEWIRGLNIELNMKRF